MRLARSNDKESLSFLSIHDAMVTAGIVKATKDPDEDENPQDGQDQDNDERTDQDPELPSDPVPFVNRPPSAYHPGRLVFLDASDPEVLVARWMALADDPDALAAWVREGLLIQETREHA